MLPDAVSSNFREPAAAVFYVSVLLDGELHRRTYTQAFHQLYGAKRWLEHMMGDETATRLGHELRLDESGIRIRCFELDRVLEYSYRDREEERWQLPVDIARMVARYRRGTWFTETADNKLDERKLIVKPAKVEQVKKPKVPDGYVTVTELCRGTSVVPMNARALLRTIMAKPDYGWAFAPNKLSEIRKIIGVS